jgi:nitric oxide reductase activation protein
MKRLEEDPQTKKEMEEQSQKETQAGLDGEQIQKALEEAINQLKRNGDLMQPCSSVTGHGTPVPGLQSNLTPETNQRTKQMSEEELQENPVIKQQFPNGPGAPADIVTWRPVEDDYSRDKYQQPNQGLVQRMKGSFAMRPSAMEWTDRLQKAGAVDEDEVWRAGAGDMRFFEKKTIESTPDTKIALLVDCSGSMNGRKLRSATDVASIIHACTKDMNGVDVMVYGHTGDNGIPGEGNAGVFRVWERGEPVSRLGTLMTQVKGDNYDGYALGYVTQELLKRSTPEEQKILFIMSDGLPNGWGATGRGWGSGGYGGEEAMNHIRQIVRWAGNQGVDIIQVAIDPSMRPEEQMQMYKHWIPFETLEQLPGQVMNILKKLL